MRESREEEYIRRMRQRGYTPTLAGMDDDDIEWELAKMDGMDPFGGTRPAEQPLNPTYRPADPAMVARIYRQMGRPYDASLISREEKYYLNGGWDNGEDDKDGTENPVTNLPDFEPRNGSRNRDTLLPDFRPQQGGEQGPIWSIDPRTKGWRPALGIEGGPVKKPWQPEKYLDGVQLASAAIPYGGFAGLGGGDKSTLAKTSGKDIMKKVTEVGKEVIKLSRFGEKAYKVAKEQGWSHDEAMEIARETQTAYGIYKVADWGTNLYLLSRGKGQSRKTLPTYFIKEEAEEMYDDEIHNNIIQSAIDRYKLAKNPPEGWIPPP